LNSGNRLSRRMGSLARKSSVALTPAWYVRRASSTTTFRPVDVNHEFSHPEQMLQAIRASLKPNGRVALAEFRAEDRKVPIKKLHKISKEKILKEFEPNGFKLVEEFDELPWQHLMFFERGDGP